MVLELAILVELIVLIGVGERDGRLAKLLESTVAVGGSVLADGQAVDTEEGGDTVDDQNCPVHVHDKSKDQVQAQVPELERGIDHMEAQPRQVNPESTNDKRGLQDSPERERLAQEMGEDNHGGHAAENEGDDPDEEDKVVVGQDAGVGGEEPGTGAQGEANDRNPLLHDGSESQTLLLAGDRNVPDTSGKVTKEETDEKDRKPKVLDRVVAEKGGPVDELNNRTRPDARAPNTGSHQDTDGDEQTLGGSVEVAQVQSVSVESLPGREVHGEARHNRSPHTEVGGAEAHARSGQQASKSAVQRVNSVTGFR